ncbi:hypothetical protein EVAR_100499_1 [Eumeta japonica]|uniref:Uncharacterized protein n=1 Tax=Eumeta variegata TaxID=151549 RepID=A0A4C1ZZ21_EUMVA|nr:hypothetical protein EVAR_100499_1 [Eumeta japonica]
MKGKVVQPLMGHLPQQRLLPGQPVESVDNGTFFVGGNKEISKFVRNNCNSLAENATSEGIAFYLIPAWESHYGGLWEAGVKSVKHHLHRLLDDLTSLTPGHFLIGRPLTALPVPSYNSNESHLTRYQRIEQLRQHFGLDGVKNI